MMIEAFYFDYFKWPLPLIPQWWGPPTTRHRSLSYPPCLLDLGGGGDTGVGFIMLWIRAKGKGKKLVPCMIEVMKIFVRYMTPP